MKNFYYKYKDKFVNLLLNINNFIIYNIFQIKYNIFTYHYKLKLDYYDEFTIMDIEDFNDKYITRQPWGDYHDGDLQQWYDPNAVKLSNLGLELSITNNTKEITSYQVNKVLLHNQPKKIINNGVGLVSSKRNFGYGVYICNIQLPKGVGLWPAVWVSGRDSWPPEIDFIEGYSDKNGKYNKNLNTNIHCGSHSSNHYNIGVNRHGLFINDTKNIELICHWTEKFIKIYYNGFLCKILTNPKDLLWFKQQNMYIIFNNALRKDIISNGKFDLDDIAKSPLIIKNFKYYI